jgi:D-alanyl-D-alanine carboxypeptidase
VKTGSTALAGDCLVAAATRDGRTYIVVALKSQSPGDDAEKMLDWAFGNWATVEVAQRRTEVIGDDGTKGIPAAPLAVSVPAGTQSQVRTYVTAEAIEADYDGKVLSSVPRVRAAR